MIKKMLPMHASYAHTHPSLNGVQYTKAKNICNVHTHTHTHTHTHIYTDYSRNL